LGKRGQIGPLSYPLSRIFAEDELGQDVLIETQHLRTKLFKAVRVSWSRDTSYEPERWSDDNPAWGQCAVTALVLQDYLGGELRRVTDGAETTHFWIAVDGEDIDLTLEQFDLVPIWIEGPMAVGREGVLAWPDTRRRYEALRDRVAIAMKMV
jgi:hypothetical protein